MLVTKGVAHAIKASSPSHFVTLVQTLHRFKIPWGYIKSMFEVVEWPIHDSSDPSEMAEDHAFSGMTNSILNENDLS
jgi:hypothetical protein